MTWTHPLLQSLSLVGLGRPRPFSYVGPPSAFKYGSIHNSLLKTPELLHPLLQVTDPSRFAGKAEAIWWVAFHSGFNTLLFILGMLLFFQVDHKLYFPWQEEGREAERWVGYVDWRSRPALRSKHGGMLAASFVLGKLPSS